MTDPERQKVEELIASAEIAIGEITLRNGENAGLIKEMLQSLNGLRSLLGFNGSCH